MQLGFGITDAVGAALTAAASSKMGTPGASPGTMPGGTAPGTVPGSVTVSPAMQQAFTPQFSPVMQMTSESPGASQSATPTQYGGGGQTARTGIPQPVIPSPYATPLQPDALPYSAPVDAGYREAYAPYDQPVIQQSTPNINNLLLWGMVGIGAFLFLTGKSKSKPKTSKGTALALK